MTGKDYCVHDRTKSSRERCLLVRRETRCCCFTDKRCVSDQHHASRSCQAAGKRRCGTGQQNQVGNRNVPMYVYATALSFKTSPWSKLCHATAAILFPENGMSNILSLQQ